MGKPILCVDFDGVVHLYTSGWKGATIIPDGHVAGFFEWLDRAAQLFDIQMYSSRSKEPGGPEAMMSWLYTQRKLWRENGGMSTVADGIPVAISFPKDKPAAFLTIDDRGLTFNGDWQDPMYNPEELIKFKPWNKK